MTLEEESRAPASEPPPFVSKFLPRSGPTSHKIFVRLFVCLSQFHAPANIAPRELRFFLIDSSQKVFLQ